MRRIVFLTTASYDMLLYGGRINVNRLGRCGIAVRCELTVLHYSAFLVILCSFSLFQKCTVNRSRRRLPISGVPPCCHLMLFPSVHVLRALYSLFLNTCVSKRQRQASIRPCKFETKRMTRNIHRRPVPTLVETMLAFFGIGACFSGTACLF
jgi:hypothetical protein